jgi:hypothetical protein
MKNKSNIKPSCKNEQSLLKYLRENEAEKQAQTKGKKDRSLSGPMAVLPGSETKTDKNNKAGIKSIQDHK